jgi:UDP-N-acetylmuramoyl-tripeptide--D-alanyl-D-alanine ligase
MIERGSNKIILDAYNANPSSMKLAVENFAQLQAENKVLILGGMAELGDESIREHQELLDLIARHQWKDVVLVGGDFRKIKGNHLVFENSTEAKKWFQEQQFSNSFVLIKGSRSMQMENILN